MFLGNNAVKIDEKSRVILPVRFTEKIAGRTLLAIPGRECLSIFVENDLHSEDKSSVSDGYLKNKFLAAASPEAAPLAREISVKSNNRITIPPGLLEDSGLGKKMDVVVAGYDDHFKIWSKSAWDNERKRIISALVAGNAPSPAK